MRLILLVCLFLSTTARSQSLLLNGDFEVENICTEYQQACAPEAWLATVPAYPYYFEDPEGAYHGNHYVTIVSGNGRMGVHRGFVRSRLLCGMRPGAQYRLQLYVKTDFAGLLDSTGVQFSPYDMLCNKLPPAELEASFFFLDAVRKPAAHGWTRVTYVYTARGDEAYFTVGNFRRLEWGNGLTGGRSERYQVLIDSVSLLPLDPNERLCAGWQQQVDTIYSEDYRHDYQIRRMYGCSRNPPPPMVLRPNRQVKVDTLIVPDVLFATNSAELDRRALLLLDSLSRKIPPDGLDSIQVEGHTDNAGTAAWNQELSEARAASVGHYLEYGHAVPILTRGWAATRPVADNNSPAGRRRNRRVEVYLYLRQ